MIIKYNLPDRRSLMSTFGVSWSNSTKLNLSWGISGMSSSTFLKTVDLANCNIATWGSILYLCLLLVMKKLLISYILPTCILFVMNLSSFTRMKPCIASFCKKKKKKNTCSYINIVIYILNNKLKCILLVI